jgi:stress-induced morphogen
VEIISDAFKGMNPVQCHRTVYGILDEELKNGVHALSLKAKAA